MNSVTNHPKAASRVVRCALRSVLACALVIGSTGAFAQQYGERQYDRRDDPALQQSGRARMSQDRDPRYDVRAYEEQRRLQQQYQQQFQQQQQQFQQEQREARRGGRLTPDERRDLRRQINEAGMDLYPSRR